MVGYRRSLSAARMALVVVSVAAAGCGSTSETNPAQEGTRDTRSAGEANTAPQDSSNERRLSYEESIRLVRWATAFRSCLLAEGLHVGPLVTSETRIETKLPASLSASDVLPLTETCGSRQGGPPPRASLQYRPPSQIVLYLPKQCVLDTKVTTS
jgi:hypothetical protein